MNFDATRAKYWFYITGNKSVRMCNPVRIAKYELLSFALIYMIYVIYCAIDMPFKHNLIDKVEVNV